MATGPGSFRQKFFGHLVGQQQQRLAGPFPLLDRGAQDDVDIRGSTLVAQRIERIAADQKIVDPILIQGAQ